MPSSKTVRSLSFLRWVLLLPIPALWMALEHYGLLKFIENKSVDWRFQYRGEIPSPAKVVYVDVDSISLDIIGGQPWSRAFYADVAEALVKEAKVRAVAFDFVFSEAGLSESVDRRKHVIGNQRLRKFLASEPIPPVALGAAYGGHKFTDLTGKVRVRSLALVASDTRKIAEIEPPELPVLEQSIDPDKSIFYNPPIIGLIDTIDGGTRMVPTWVPTNIRPYFHLSVELARLYWELPHGSIKVSDDALRYVRADGAVVRTVPLLQKQILEVNWFSPWLADQNRRFSFVDVYKYVMALRDEDAELRAAGKEFFSSDVFRDAIVLVGPVDPLLQDLAPTPFDEIPVPKVGVHGNLVKTIISGAYLQRLPPWGIHAIIFSLTVVVATLSLAGGSRALFAKLVAVLTFGVYAALAFRLFAQTHIVLPFIAPLGAALSTSFAGLIWQVIEEQKAKGRIKGMFGAYVSPQLVERMVESGEDPQLGGHEEHITAYFSDIQGFSSFSEKLPPAKLVELMNEYLTACTDIVQSQGGTLDKYIGDAVVAMYGAPIPLPDHAHRACIATQLVHQKLGELRVKWKSEGDKWPEIVWKMQSRIGLNSGLATIGNMGSRTRFNYTMMGDNVNLAARMESGAKSWGAYTMVTQATKEACEKHGDRVVFRALGRIVVMGRSQPVPIYEIVGLKDTLTPTAQECIGLFDQAMAKYYARDWDGAIALFKQSAELEPNQPGKTPGVKTNPSLVYIEKVVPEAIEEPPPDGWDGRYIMKEK